VVRNSGLCELHSCTLCRELCWDLYLRLLWCHNILAGYFGSAELPGRPWFRAGQEQSFRVLQQGCREWERECSGIPGQDIRRRLGEGQAEQWDRDQILQARCRSGALCRWSVQVWWQFLVEFILVYLSTRAVCACQRYLSEVWMLPRLISMHSLLK